MQRVAIVGCSGGGKSTLARALGKRLGLPVVHMDTLFWLPDWTESDRDEFRVKVDEAASADAWVMDGGFITHSRARFERADTIVWIELPIWFCLMRAIWRMLTHFGRSRADLAPGCLERFDMEFYRYIWNWDRDSRPRMQAAIDTWAPQARLYRLRSDREMRRFVSDPFAYPAAAIPQPLQQALEQNAGSAR